MGKKVLGSFVGDTDIIDDVIGAIKLRCPSFKLLERRIANYEEIISNSYYSEALARYAASNDRFEVIIFEKTLTLEDLDDLTCRIALQMI